MVESNWSFNYNRFKLGGKLYWKELKELKIELPHDPAVSLLSIFLRKTNTLIEKKKKRKCTLTFTGALFTTEKV